jgi:hypothetical protein
MFYYVVHYVILRKPEKCAVAMLVLINFQTTFHM